MGNFKNKLSNLVKIHSQSGVGLAESLAALGIMGVVIVGLLSQQRLSNKSSMNIYSENEINNIMKRVTTEIGIQGNCSLPENFVGQSPARSGISALVRSPGGSPTPGNTIIADNSEYGVGQGQVYIDDISSRLNSSNKNEMILSISFRKKENSLTAGALQKFTTRAIKKELPLNIVTDSAGNITACYGSYDLIVKTAIELACQGNAAFYDATVNPPYGKCVHTEEIGAPPISQCPAGQFLKKVDGATATDKVRYSCESLTQACAKSEQVIIGFKSNGVPECGLAYKQCTPGSILVKVASGGFVCTKINCSPTQGFSGFDSSGNPICRQIPGPYTCGSGTAYQVNNDGSVTCNTQYVAGGSCGPGERIQGIKADGTFNCVPFIKIATTCSSGYAISGVDASGNVLCKLINRPLACDGTKSSNTYATCKARGGTIRYIGTGNSQCSFSGSVCPGGFNRCQSYGSQGNVSCTDTSSTYYCNANVATRWAYAASAGAYGNFGLVPQTCKNWYGAPNTSQACFSTDQATTFSSQLEVGCY